VLKLIEEKWNLPTLTRRDTAATSPLTPPMADCSRSGVPQASQRIAKLLFRVRIAAHVIIRDGAL
jgi:hypothetical protein